MSQDDNSNDRYNDRVQRRHDVERTWSEYRQLVMNELTRLNTSLLDLNNRLDRNYHEYQAELSKLKIDLAMIQVKTGIWGGLMGALSGVITALGLILLKQH